MARKNKNITGYIGSIAIYRGTDIHFDHYLKEQIGASWWDIRDDLYESGYSALEVSDYRDSLLADFKKLAANNGLRPII